MLGVTETKYHNKHLDDQKPSHIGSLIADVKSKLGILPSTKKEVQQVLDHISLNGRRITDGNIKELLSKHFLAGNLDEQGIQEAVLNYCKNRVDEFDPRVSEAMLDIYAMPFYLYYGYHPESL